jgi:feruloyl esterase
MRNWVSLLFSLAPSAALLCAIDAAPASAATCESLTGLALPQVTITAAQSIPAGTFTAPGGQRFADLPAFCRVSAFATPTPKSHIGFEVWMPASGWNQKFEGNGSGGSAGAIGYAPMANALKHNFATVATDNGHIGSSWTFADPPERIVDFGGRALHLSTIAGKAITTAFYGAAAKRSYYIGCSQGGHHGLMEAQRYPEDYDGIVAGDPPTDWTHLMTGELWAGVKTSVKGPSSDLPQTQLNLVTKAVLAQCAGHDGGLKTDAFLNDPRACHFDPKVLQCHAEQSPDTCLSADQVAAVEALYQGAVNPRTHKQIYPGFAPGSETFWRQVLVGKKDPGGSSNSFFREGLYADRPDFDPLKFDFDKDVQYADTKEAAEGKTWAEALSPDNPDLSAFKARGGKLIVYHGFADPFVTPYGVLSYYAAVVDAMKKGGKDGLGGTRDFARLFMAPGLNHCSGGPGANVFNGATRGAPEDPDHDVFLALTRWVETGAPPNRIVATKFNNDKPGEGVAFTRPLCPYPEVAEYKGSGDPNSAASFACIAAPTGGSTPKYSGIIAPRRTAPR